MNNIFLCLKKGGKNTAKYIIFSVFFVFAFLFGINSVVDADFSGSIFPPVSNNANAFDDNDQKASGGSGDLTSINGALINKCEVTNEVGPNRFNYLISSSSYTGGNSGSTNCVAYVPDDTDAKHTFYLQANDAAGSKNVITFNVTVPTKYKYIVVFEDKFSMSEGIDGQDYDLYTLKQDLSGYTFERQASNATTTARPHDAGTLALAGTEDNYTFTFTYTLREFNYGKHEVFVYFYNADYHTNNETAVSNLEFVLAKPINTFTSAVYKDNASAACDFAANNICIFYTSKPNAGGVDDTHKTNAFTIQMSNSAAFYFSTVNTHSAVPPADRDPANYLPSEVKTYNSIFATNTFTNEGETDGIVYHYFNLEDKSVYDYAITTKAATYSNATPPVLTAENNYKFILTIDASGTYKFFLIDIFGNTITIESTSLEVNDISNRDLTIYFLAYGANNDTVAYYGTTLDSFELKEALSAITNQNVTIGLEFYFKIEISPDFGVTSGDTSDAEIKMNPLYYESSDKLISMQNQTTSANNTYFCRKAVSGASNTECVSDSGNSNFKENALNVTQTIAANNTTGLKAIENTFTFKTGLLDEEIEDIVSHSRKNRVDLIVNENGDYYVRLQDTQGNSTDADKSHIEVSIIDQLNPVITVNSTNTLDNYICSSMYVMGGGGSISQYPTAKYESASGCATNSQLYDHFVSYTPGETAVDLTISKTLSKDTENYKATTNGFYDKDTFSVSFNYADAIRMALLRASDSITIYNTTEATTDDSIEKSVYEKTVDTYTKYAIYTLAADKTNFTSIGDPFAATPIDYDSSKRVNYQNDAIISSGYIQYSSELDRYSLSSQEFVRFVVYPIQANGSPASDAVCQSTDGVDCYNIVNTYIDKTIDFQMVFYSKDYAGNESLPITVNIEVVDNTTPGIANIPEDSATTIDFPTIQKSNINTDCRLEIGSNLQSKSALLKCYGLKNDDNTFNFVDNAATYSLLKYDPDDATNKGYKDENYYNNILLSQLFDDYDGKIKVYVCRTRRSTTSACTNDWVEVTESSAITFANAGNYEIKIEISDHGKKYDNTTYTSNKITLIFCFYVNPRVLLVRPLETEKTYGEANPTIDYCIYATKSTNTFRYNLFNIPAGDSTYTSTYDFVLQNYETGSYAYVYCTNNLNAEGRGDSATSTTWKDILALEDSAVTGKDFDDFVTGALSRTYATGTTGSGGTKHNLELVTSPTSDSNYKYNAYEDAGYYRITMGNLKITTEGELDDNYVLRLHPSYLLEGEDPDTALKNYHELTGDKYKYGVNSEQHGETISNVLYTIKQAELTVNANGGNKVYGNKDTNYSQVSNNSAKNNISSFTYITSDTDMSVTTTDVGSTAGYLNGFTISGLINSGTADAYLSDYSSSDTNGYERFIVGYLRRYSGEKVGTYRICNITVTAANNSITDCGETVASINNITGHTVELTASNVFIDKAGTTAVGDISKISYGMYVLHNGKLYRLTRDNTDLTNKVFTNFMEAELWRYNYDDSDYSLKIVANTNNSNQNYYITYTGAIYTINPRTLIVQPGVNQGKEYSNPTHNDPLFEIVVYGETVNITAGSGDAAFNGYTESVSAIGYPHESAGDALTHESAPYNSNAGGKTPDTAVYFSDRRTTAHSLSNITYTYKFDDITLVDNKFTLDGHVYKYDSSNDNICPVLTTDEDECINNGEFIGVNKVTISAGKVSITWVGKLTYQDYELFTSDGTAGTGKISRAVGEVVGWYNYVFTAEHLRNVTNGNNECSATASYVYSVGGTSACVNYNVSFKDEAPSVVELKDSDDNVIGKEFITATSGSEYKHNGDKYCNDSVYSLGCGTDVTNIKFSIFKRDIILSFNAATKVYGNVYNYFDTEAAGVFYIDDNGSLPLREGTTTPVVTCYRKKTAADTGVDVYTVNGVDYVALTPGECGSDDYGLSASDTWGTNGLKLKFFLHADLSGSFTESTYALPAGLYHVYATIGGGTHANYNLVYVDFDILVATKGANQENGALKITPRPVKIIGTYYAKEFGQAKYAYYDENGTSLQEVDSSTRIQGEYKLKLTNTTTINIFDNNYYYCVATEDTYNGVGVSYGCTMDATRAVSNNYNFAQSSNVYLYTVVDIGSGAMVSLADGKTDEIYANFAGAPTREATRSGFDTTNDAFGLLDNVGFYDIDMAGITPVIAQYSGVTFSRDKTSGNGTIYRYTNYQVADADKIDGGLYIMPAQIQISVTDGQKKMYGCAYNTVSTSVDGIRYTYENGYNCVESVEQYYDLGYQYTVTGDKAKYLKDNADDETVGYKVFNVSCTLDKRGANSDDCVDIVYTGLSYTVTPDYNVLDGDGNARTQTTGKGSGEAGENTSLNSGNMYRIPDDTGETVTYSYADYFAYATAAQKAPNASGVRFQEQDVDTYAITLGNLDAEFNSNVMCNGFSAPLSSGGTSKCKNFIVNYGGNNTATHTSVSGVDTFDDTAENMTLTVADHDFTITTRNVVVTTEYNYKVHGDTEPNEGYRCKELKDMFTYASGYGDAFNFSGRSYCTDNDTFISTGVTRFYAMDNSLAKAPWTGWVDETAANAASQTYAKYNDTLYDVFDNSNSVIKRAGETGAANPTQNDAVGTYDYTFYLHLREDLTGANYAISYLVVTDNSGTNSYSTNETSTNAAGGFATDNSGKLDRWYSDGNHKCLGTSAESECTSYSGTQTFRFTINGIAYGEQTDSNQYKVTHPTTSATLVSTLVPRVYFEIVRREIFIQTQPVTKDYGFEDTYTMFDVALCSEYAENSDGDYVCTPVAKTNEWGKRNSLSNADYAIFYPSGTFDQAAFKGSDNDAVFRGDTTVANRAFGIYFYRTYGENVGEYVIVACATQSADDTACREYYTEGDEDEDIEFEDGTEGDADRLLVSNIKEFTADTPNNAYNASNYIVKPIPSIITINTRNLHITPDSDQGFMYGNYPTGYKVPPITFTEQYYTNSAATTTQGLVNGGLIISDDHVNNQIALCIYDIEGNLTCINDRQNSSGGTVVKYVMTTLHGGSVSTATSTAPAAGAILGTLVGSYNFLGYNVYNDAYNDDNDTSRFALNRSYNSTDGQRYNRDVGTYIITAGELVAGASHCSATGEVNCLNTNYDIAAFYSTAVEYEITPATIVVTPKADQKKTYGDNDTHLKFDVETTFTFDTVPNQTEHDKYYQTGETYQTAAVPFGAAYDATSGNVVLAGFAYDEDQTISATGYNYGKGRQANKANQPQSIVSDYSTDSNLNPKYYDKYCYSYDSSAEADATAQTCEGYSASSNHKYASLQYGSTSRILLGYFYVENWAQEQGTHHIMNGITVAKNANGTINYLYKTSAGVDVTIGDYTGVDFKIEKLAVDAQIKDITKVYGQATDSHKCDAVNVTNHYECKTNYATLTALDNEGRLEYNFDVTGTGVNTVGTDIILTKAVNGRYYTQTSLPEHKNIHLGLTVVRAINNTNVCVSDNDKFGCEDAGTYVLVFRKQDVTNGVDNNYSVTFAGAAKAYAENQEGYAIVNSIPTGELDESDGKAASNAVTYTSYHSTNTLDSVPTGQNSAENPTAVAIKIVSDYTVNLVINKRNVTFYVGTYNEDGSVAERYVIEQNEQVPKFPLIVDESISYEGNFSTLDIDGDGTHQATNPKSEQVHYVTWFDDNQYNPANAVVVSGSTHAPRQVRTSDKVLATGKAVTYGVGLCPKASSDVRGEVNGSANCSEIIYYEDANKIGADGKYIFDTSIIGDYAIIRNKDLTHIVSYKSDNSTANSETRNYTVADYNGTLVIYQDQTAPIIQTGNNNSDSDELTEFVLEANAHQASCTSVQNEEGKTFNYNCNVNGKLFADGVNAQDRLGQIIKYITNNYSAYNGAFNKYMYKTSGNQADTNKSIVKLPDTLATISGMSIYMPVNNIGAKDRVTTLYKVDRSANTYDFDTDYITESASDNIDELTAISTIISWFNITSYDYSYIRGTDYVSKRYTPRYYFYIHGLQQEDKTFDDDRAFDPTYVGDFKLTIYAIDNVGNLSSKNVELRIVDTTDPTTGEVHIFNAPVVCTSNPCLAADLSDWHVKAGYVNINAFIKYTSAGVEDNTNGTYIKLNGTLTDLYGTTIQRYADTSGTKSILGQYVLVENSATAHTPASEVEHKYWSSDNTKYMVVVGGQDNSFIDDNDTVADIDDSESQWDTYYTIDNGTTWYKYARHANEGVAITFKDGNTTLYTRVLDSGRKYSVTVDDDGYTYYNDIYLRYTESAGVNACTGLSENCTVITGEAKSITQVKDAPMTAIEGGYTFKIHSILITYLKPSGENGTVEWEGLATPKSVNTVTPDGGSPTLVFTFGIMTCTIDVANLKVNCETEYKLVYRNNATAKDKVTIASPVYTITDERNIGAWDTAVATATGFYKDRRYIFIDTMAPTIALNGKGYVVFEYDQMCKKFAVGESDSICEHSYEEEFLNASDTLSTTNTTSAVDSEITSTLTELTVADYGNIAWFTGGGYSLSTTLPATAGLLENNTLVMSGNATLNTTAQVHDTYGLDNATFNKHRVDLYVYLNVSNPGQTTIWYRYLAIYSGSAYYVFRQQYDTTNNKYANIEKFNTDNLTTYDTIEEVLEYIVSTASITLASTDTRRMLTFSINYEVKDAAGNVSTPVANVTVRGVVYTKLTSTIAAAVPANVGVMSEVGDNVYMVNATQGVSLSKLLNGFTVSNIDKDGNNNIDTIKQSLYYNGEVIYENIGYNSDVLATLDDYTSVPGVYTLRLTSTRVTESEGKEFTVTDKPLEINFVIEPAVASIVDEIDRSNVIAPIMMMALVSMFLLGLGYVSIRKSKKQ